ncbi:protein DA1-related 1 isoform X1 [Selaginella moellendorffii]|uniref:protein DA1-related 1 isoform X1 n=1 Tax=Selaginella moellendorffii TaxID=88036 RepID=UPI000D1C91AE|nr:protein DA1-related 1 isoform X1 [Selaginella moellendorffii]|eukprot:XP_024526252.1 protein DA1-related 1 isoform X1 [Selaginella moellendorffii]
MKWFDKIFKPLHQKVHEISHNSSSEADEELDRAIALSLSDHYDDKPAARDKGATDNDEALARALQESFISEGPSGFSSGFSSGFPFGGDGRTRRFSGAHVCARCKKTIGPGRFLSCMGGLWHPECFRCTSCNKPISGSEFSVSGNDPYHKDCYKELFHPRCDVCNLFIPPNYSGLIEYRVHPFWGQRYCPSHEDDNTPRCCSCERLETKNSKYVVLDDGRKLCLECMDSAVMDTNEGQPLYQEIINFYEGMNMKITQQIPMLLVERQALNEARAHESNGHHLTETRGLTLSEEQTVTSVSGSFARARLMKCLQVFRRPRSRGFFGEMRTESMKLRRNCEVTAILVLYGLPRLLTGSILAHELMHAWLRLNGYPSHLNPVVEEGICQVMAHTWLESQIGSSSSSSHGAAKPAPHQFDTSKLREFVMHQIAMDPSPAYGDGFRIGQSAVVQFGLPRTLDHIKLTGDFPVS